MSELAIVIPTRGRPYNIDRAWQAWQETRAFDNATMILVIDEDDPAYRDYMEFVTNLPGVDFCVFQKQQPMVRKLNIVAQHEASVYPFVGFMGDDHVPRTNLWAQRYIRELSDMGTGIVYGDDLHRGEALPTQWAMTSDIVLKLSRMVPAKINHLFCDRVILDLGKATGCIKYLPDVQIEHMHYQAGKSTKDHLYAQVNNKQNFDAERSAYLRWHQEQLPGQVQKIQELING